MKNLLYSLLRLLLVFLTSSIVFFALIVVAGKLLTPYFDKKAPVISHLISNILKKPVEIKQFSIAWQGLTPIFHASEIAIWDNTQHHRLLSIHTLNIGINIFRSLLHGSLRLGPVDINGVQLVVHQLNDNSLVFTGISTLLNQSSVSKTKGMNELAALILTEPQFSLENIRLTFYPKTGPVWPLMRVALRLKNNRNKHQVSGQLHFLQEKMSTLNFKADLEGTPSALSLNNLKGLIYLQGHHILLDQWMNAWKPTAQISSINTNFEIWARWQSDHWDQFQGFIDNLQSAQVKMEKQPLLTFSPFVINLLGQFTPQTWHIDAVVHQFGMKRWRAIPGIQNLDAYLHITPDHGKLFAHSNGGYFDFGPLFKSPLPVNRLFSQLNWQKKNNEWIIQVPQFEANNDEVSVNAQWALLVPKVTEQSEMSLLAHVKLNDSGALSHYLPQTQLGPELIHWLSTAINKGSSVGSLVLQGPLNQFPFDKHNGTFLIDTHIKDATLTYDKAWPRLEKLNGDLIFSGRKMHISVHSANLLDTTLNNIQADIPIIKKKVQAVLTLVSHEINTRLEQGHAFLMASPLAKGLLGQLKNLILIGPLNLRLQMAIPLEAGKQKLTVLGSGQIERAQLKIPQHAIQLDQLTGFFNFNENGVTNSALTGILWKKPIELAIHSIPTLQITVHYEGILTQLKPEQQGWQFSVDNKMAKGTILIPNDNVKPIVAHFEKINLDSSAEFNKVNTWNFKQLPKMNVDAKAVYYNAIRLGAVQLKLNPVLGGVLIRELNAGDENYHLIASGAWHIQGSHSTELRGQLDSGQLSNFLRNWGLPTSMIAEQSHIKFNLHWLGSPYQINLRKLNGYFSFNATNGQIVDIGSSNEAKLNFGRLLTFLSIQSLTRRLQLDFSDLKTKGFDFTNLQGHFTLRNGHAVTRDTTIEGPVALINIAGRVGILNKDYDLTIKVVPHFTSSLPVIVGLAGGPVAGVVTWLANAVLGSTVQKIAETSYHITGSWDKPDVVKTSIR